MAINRTIAATVAAIFLAGAPISVTRPILFAQSTAKSSIAVGPQYDTTHVYVSPSDLAMRSLLAFSEPLEAKAPKQVVATVTPTPSKTTSQLLQTPVGTVSLFGFLTPIPAPFSTESTGYLVTNMDAAIKAARAAGADVLVDPFPDPIGRDAVIQWPGGVNIAALLAYTDPLHYTPLLDRPREPGLCIC